VNEFRYINKQKFTHLVDCHEKRFEKISERKLPAKISEDMINALFHTLDLDGNDNLDHNEIFGVLAKRVKLGQGSDDDLKDAVKDGLGSFISAFRQRTGL